MSTIRAIILALVLTLPATVRAVAAEPEISVSVSIEKTSVSVGEPFQYQITIDGTTQGPDLELPAIANAQVSGGNPVPLRQSSVVIINGQRTDTSSESVTYRWLITPTKPGPIVIPAFEVSVGGKSYATEEVRVQVSPAEASDAILLRASVETNEAYVGQLVKLRVTFFTSRSTADLPVFDMPGIAGNFTVHNTDVAAVLPNQLALEFLGSQSVVRDSRTTINGVGYSAFTLERSLVPTRPGEFTIGPATVVVAIADRSTRNPWDAPRYRRVTASSEPITIKVKALPKDGMPADFSGLVGDYEIEAAASPTDVSVGDPIALTVTIRGPEPLDRIADPVTEKNPALAGAFRIIADAQAPKRSGGKLVFSRTIRTANDKVTEIPALELNYFDPESGTYRTASTAPIPLTVRPTRMVTAADAIGGEAPLANGEAIESRAGGLVANRVATTALVDRSFDLAREVRSPTFIAAVASPPGVYALAVLVAAHRRRSTNSQARRRQRAMPAALATLDRADLDPAARASAAVRGLLGDLIGGTTGHVLTPQEAHDLLAPRSPDLAGSVRDLLVRCDAARFASSSGDTSSLLNDARALLPRIAQEARS